MKNAACNENKDMKDAMAYIGTMSMILTTCLEDATSGEYSGLGVTQKLTAEEWVSDSSSDEDILKSPILWLPLLLPNRLVVEQGMAVTSQSQSR